MSEASSEQRNVYKGSPARAWMRLRLISRLEEVHEMDFLVDTGNPCAIIIDVDAMLSLRWRDSTSADSNFGSLDGGWLRLSIPEFDFDAKLLGHANDQVVSIVKRSHSSFAGLVGLPLLRMVEYGGDGGWFWVRRQVMQ